MKSDVVIHAEGLSKRYRIGALQEPYKTLRDSLIGALKSPLRTFRKDQESFWALKDVSFEVRRGEVIGIIGRNGAGKSTLLKILSRITKPTEGQVVIRGRVGSLLEVGTGFHPELTGRENVYLNGAILGMRRREIDRRFDEIVDFAEIEKFLDTPVKRYSSGMYVRLAFAVAAHLEPEILLVDEVLAVGDAAFQKKCLGKMGEVAEEGRTVILVSHNLIAVQKLCSRAVLLKSGHLTENGVPKYIIESYLSQEIVPRFQQKWPNPTDAPGNNEVRLKTAALVLEDTEASSDFLYRSNSFWVRIEFWSFSQNANWDITLQLVTDYDIIAFVSGVILPHKTVDCNVCLFRAEVRIPGHLLNTGTYSIDLLIGSRQKRVVFRRDRILSFDVLDDTEGRGTNFHKIPGAVRPQLIWKTDVFDAKSVQYPE